MNDKDIKNRGRHPSKDIIGIDGDELSNKKIVLCVSGSIAAYRAIDLARLLMRHGAEVYPVTSSATSLLLNSEILKWATGNSVVDSLSGDLEHVSLADYNMSDLIIVYPCTANTIGKIANGIDDTPITSVISVGVGSKIPIILAPAMHESMYNNPFIGNNIEKLRSFGIIISDPVISEGKAKVSSIESLFQMAKKILTKNTQQDDYLLSGKKILITAGGTIEYIDPVRVITNLSSGKMGIEIAKAAAEMGASVTLITGNRYNTTTTLPVNIRIINILTSNEMYESVVSELSKKHYDIVILAAAVSDFTYVGKQNMKISSSTRKLTLTLEPTKKIIDIVKKINKKIFLVGFKAEFNVSNSELIDNAYKKLIKSNSDLIIANDVGKMESTFGSDNNEVYIINKQKKTIHLTLQSKSDISKKILKIISSYLK